MIYIKYVNLVGPFSDDLRVTVILLQPVRVPPTGDVYQIDDHYWWFKFWIEECPQASLGEAAKFYQLKAFL